MSLGYNGYRKELLCPKCTKKINLFQPRRPRGFFIYLPWEGLAKTDTIKLNRPPLERGGTKGEVEKL